MAQYEEYIKDPHSGEVALIKANDKYLFLQKKESKYEAWEKRAERVEKQRQKADKLYEATQLTESARKAFLDYSMILQATLTKNDRLNWDELKDFKKYKIYKSKLSEPSKEAFFMSVPKKSILEFLMKNKRIRRESLEKLAMNRYEIAITDFNESIVNEKKEYELEKLKYYTAQAEHNKEIDDLREAFESANGDAIEKYLEYVFSKSEYPEPILLQYDVFYVAERRTVVLNVDLPSPDSLPKITEFKYVQTRNEITTKEMKKLDFKKLYEDVVSQIVIRTIHEAFESLYVDVADFVVFNGFVDSIDKKTGNPFRSCIVSIQAEKDYFNSINLNNVNPLECIKGLKGLIASEFINLAPVKPILNLDRNDKRIIESQDIIDSIDLTNNLADMEWQKFEILVRDLFAKEFAGDGVDVRVTQASRDAGVDAIIFDPDPIKGGKFVIQAKRYNNVVGVSAVRDLYGTMINEGAVKGILVTTSTFGKDSIEFAKDKPLALLSGAELIHMFNKHGYDVCISTKKK